MSEPSLTLSVAGVSAASLAESVASSAKPKRNVAAIVIVVVLVWLTTLVIVRVACVIGVTKNVRIDGASMAETLVGLHYEATCRDCGITVSYDATGVAAGFEAACPNCGFRHVALTENDIRRGDLVLIDSWPMLFRRPQRGEIVAIREPSKSQSPSITKRVVALPGENLAIREGDLYIDGRIWQKDLSQLRAEAVLVHDNNFRPALSKKLPERWRPDARQSAWQTSGSDLIFTPSNAPALTAPNLGAAPAEKKVDWISYHHWACTDTPTSRTADSAILDNDAYNPAQSRRLNPASDVMLTCRLQAQGEGSFYFAATDEPHRFTIEISPAREEIIVTDGDDVLERRAIAVRDPRDWQMTIATCDKRLIIAEGRRELLVLPYTRDEPCENRWPLSIGAGDLKVVVSNVKVFRDIYYLEPHNTDRVWRADAPLAPNQFALLGDNPPVSVDSRQWASPVTRGQVLGLVYRPFWRSE